MNTSINADIRKIAKKSIDRADDTTVKMILAMLKIKERESAVDNDFDIEMERRFQEYEQGKITPLTLDELENRVRNAHIQKIKPAI